MYVLIDTTNYQPLAKHSQYIALAALAYIQFANVDAVIVPLDGQNKHWSQFNHDQLLNIAIAIGQGVQYEKKEGYAELITHIRSALEHNKNLVIPYDVNKLIVQAQGLPSTAAEPYAYDASSDKAKKTPKWSVAPQRNRARTDSQWRTQFAAGNAGHPMPPLSPAAPSAPGVPQAPKAPAAPGVPRPPAPPVATGAAPAAPKAPSAPGKAPAPLKAAPATAPAAAAAPKPPKEASGPATRPKAGTSTGQVWDIADRVSVKYPANERTGKPCRAEVIAECEKAGINKSTASVQFGKWASAQ